MGNTCIPVAYSFWYLAKLMQFVKLKNKIKKKIELNWTDDNGDDDDDRWWHIWQERKFHHEEFCDTFPVMTRSTLDFFQHMNPF